MLCTNFSLIYFTGSTTRQKRQTCRQTDGQTDMQTERQTGGLNKMSGSGFFKNRVYIYVLFENDVSNFILSSIHITLKFFLVYLRAVCRLQVCVVMLDGLVHSLS